MNQSLTALVAPLKQLKKWMTDFLLHGLKIDYTDLYTRVLNSISKE